MWSFQKENTEKAYYKTYDLPLDRLFCPPIPPSGFLKASMAKFGILLPLVVTPAREGFLVLDGKQRYHVAREMGLKTVPVIAIELSGADKAELAHWHAGLLMPDKMEQERVAAIIEEARKRDVITDQDIPVLSYLNEEQLIASLKTLLAENSPAPQT